MQENPRSQMKFSPMKEQLRSTKSVTDLHFYTEFYEKCIKWIVLNIINKY